VWADRLPLNASVISSSAERDAPRPARKQPDVDAYRADQPSAIV
jgi:hypothetical protein